MKYILVIEGTSPVIEAESPQKAFNQWTSLSDRGKMAFLDRVEVWTKEDYLNDERGFLEPQAEYELG